MARLEHVNITVSDLDATADRLHDLFGWTRRWEGASIYGGRSIHVGSTDDYLAIYARGDERGTPPAPDTYGHVGGLNHLGIVVDDLDATEAKVVAMGMTPENHADYEPGRRFYFTDPDGIEFEIVSYE